jgi:hypothetical protein
MSDIDTFPAEFGRHFDTSTGTYCWDGREGGLDFDVWAYDNGHGVYTVVGKQMLPDQMGAPPATDVIWSMILDSEGEALYQQDLVIDPLAPRVALEALPEACQAAVWEAACTGFFFGDVEVRYDLATGEWVPA